ncbi:hypothetical protein [Methylobacterium haplocladii]|uniref:Uncharacterized protein n=1 Tax=Methylobacterium haplocladii TaxID=1176176 RepID=A0A512ISE0_9HYPH|nr:hypothetical protein [Methylobacterium haplocladii]GEP00632.1 hypothetical protein MHA02_30190 [Methylobacterium haplocladii]GLS57780.1 hypothetical protein GCM10007887_04360 [Methylobacterium haplocladii]
MQLTIEVGELKVLASGVLLVDSGRDVKFTIEGNVFELMIDKDGPPYEKVGTNHIRAYFNTDKMVSTSSMIGDYNGRPLMISIRVQQQGTHIRQVFYTLGHH